MKVSLIISYLILFTACGDSSNKKSPQLGDKNSRITNIPLNDSLGAITICIPTRYDTSFSWIDNPNCGTSDDFKFRFQPKKLEILKEQCWPYLFYLWVPRQVVNIDRLTFKYYSRYLQSNNFTDSMFIFEFHDMIKAESGISDGSPYKIVLDTIEKIDNHYFSVLAFEISDSTRSRFSKTLAASTFINGTVIQLGYEWFSKQDDLLIEDFIKSSKYYLGRTRFNNGK